LCPADLIALSKCRKKWFLNGGYNIIHPKTLGGDSIL
jgi:hypothetical protein